MEDCIYIEQTCRFVGHKTEYEAPQKFLNLGGDLTPALRACRDAAQIAKIINMLRWGSDSIDTENQVAVYAIEAAEHGHCKVGVTTSPSGRLTTLQVANFSELKFAGLVWFTGTAEAEEAERLVLLAAKEMGIHARGEWLKTDGAEVTEMALKAARFASLRCADSETTCANLGNRLEASRPVWETAAIRKQDRKNFEDIRAVRKACYGT